MNNDLFKAGVSRRGFLTGSAALCVMAGLGLTGCGGSGAESGSAAASGQDVEYRDELQIALPASPDGLDPHTTSSLVTMDIICNVVEPLFGLDSDYEPQPVLAKGYEVSDDGLTYTIKLREGVTFHNGKASGYTGKVSAPTKDIYYQFVTEASTRVSGFETGEYDIAGEIPTENYHDFDGNDDVKLYTHNAGVLTAFLNMNEGIFADEEIRKCALMAIDCEAAALAAYGEKELFNIDPNLGNPENTQWATDAGKKYFNQADAKAAKKALAKTSYAGETVKLLTTPDYKDMYNATVALQEQLEKAGFTAEVDSYEFATFMDIRSSKPEQWDLFVASTNYKPIPAQSLSVSKAFYGLSDEKALKLVAETRTAKDTDTAAKKWAEAQERLYEIAVIEPLCHYASITGTQADVEDVEVLDGAIIWNAKRPE